MFYLLSLDPIGDYALIEKNTDISVLKGSINEDLAADRGVNLLDTPNKWDSQDALEKSIEQDDSDTTDRIYFIVPDALLDLKDPFDDEEVLIVLQESYTSPSELFKEVVDWWKEREGEE